MIPGDVFGPMAEEYAAARPEYPPALWEAVEQRRPAAPAVAVDLAAGTGAATAGLLTLGGPVTAIEPSPAMRAVAASRMAARPGWLGAVGGRAEALPLRTGAAGVVTVAQAFHWFDAPRALDEIARALAPGGLLVLLWNVVEEDPFTEGVWSLVREFNTDYGRPVTREMFATPAALAEHEAFVAEPPTGFPHARPMTADRYVAYAFSWSYCGGALGPEERSGFERRLRELIGLHHGEAPWEERFLAAAHFARRRKEGG